MFKNRSLQVKYVKDPTDTTEQLLPTTDLKELSDDLSNKALQLGTQAVKGIALLMVTYIAADTLRQIIVKRA